MSSFTTKAQIRSALTRGKSIKLASTNMVGGAVAFSVEKWDPRGPWCVMMGGFGNRVEEGLSDIDALVSYLYRERKRIVSVR